MYKTFMDIFSDEFFKPKEFDLDKFINDVGDFDKITSMKLLDKICLLDWKDRQVLFDNPLIKNKLKIGLLSESRDNQWYYYREILRKISVKEFLSVYDAEFLDEYFNIE